MITSRRVHPFHCTAKKSLTYRCAVLFFYLPFLCRFSISLQFIKPYQSFTKKATKHTTTEIYLLSSILASPHKIIRTTSFVALTNIDEENILLSMFAKTMSDGKLVTKINRIAYDNVISGLDLGTTIYPKNITAEHIVRFVRAIKNSMGSNIETMHMMLGGKAEALEFRIADNSPVANIPLQDLHIRKNILLACIHRNGRVIIPRGHDFMRAGDTVVVITTKKGLKDIKDITE